MTGPSKISEFLSALDGSLQDGSFVKLSLGDYKGAEDGLKNIYVRKILVKRADKLSFTYRYKTRDIVKNYPLSEGLARIGDALTGGGFRVATLFTTAFDLAFEKSALKKKVPSHKDPAPSSHDRAKKRLIKGGGKAYLHALNITDEKGDVFKNAQDKYRQINKYVEILSGLIQDMAPGTLEKIVDMAPARGI
jgi:hypothetical protein